MHQSKTGQFFVMVQEPGGRRFTSKAEVAEFLATQDQAMASNIDPQKMDFSVYSQQM